MTCLPLSSRCLSCTGLAACGTVRSSGREGGWAGGCCHSQTQRGSWPEGGATALAYGLSLGVPDGPVPLTLPPPPPPPDVVFFIYLYQRWIYRVDPTRVNEFGMSGEAPTAAAPVAEAPTAAGALPPPPAPAPATTTAAAAREEASTPLPAKPTQGASSATEPQEAPPKPAEDKKRD